MLKIIGTGKRFLKENILEHIVIHAQHIHVTNAFK